MMVLGSGDVGCTIAVRVDRMAVLKVLRSMVASGIRPATCLLLRVSVLLMLWRLRVILLGARRRGRVLKRMLDGVWLGHVLFNFVCLTWSPAFLLDGVSLSIECGCRLGGSSTLDRYSSGRGCGR